MLKVQLILQVDDDPSITAAAKSLFYKKKKGLYLKTWYKWSEKGAALVDGFPQTITDRLNGKEPYIDKILITGHGGVRNGQKTIGGYFPEDLAKILVKTLSAKGNIALNRITLDGCEINETFITPFYNELIQNNITIEQGNIHAYDALVSTDKDGHRFTTKIEENALVTRYKDRSVKFGGSGYADNIVDRILDDTLPILQKQSEIKLLDRAPEIQNQIKKGLLETYLKQTIIDTSLLNILATEPKNVSFQLLQIKASDADYLILSPSKDPTNTPAFFLKSINSQGNTPSWIDIPIIVENEQAPKFLFTQTLTGGSLIVTEHPEVNKRQDYYRVYHDTRENASVFYNNVLMAIDYEDYRSSDTDGIAVSTSFMYFDGQGNDGKWKIASQPLELGDDMRNPSARSNLAVKLVATNRYQSMDLTTKFRWANDQLIKFSKKYSGVDRADLPSHIEESIFQLKLRLTAKEIDLNTFELDVSPLIEELNQAKMMLGYLSTESIKNASTAASPAVSNLSLQELQAKILSDRTTNLTLYNHFAIKNIIEDNLWSKKASEATQNLFKENSNLLDANHENVPLIHAVGEAGKDKIDIPVLDQTTLETRILSTEDARFTEFRTYLDEQTRALSEGDPVDGLNAALTIQALMGFFTHRSQSAKNLPPLAQALEIHTYFNLVQAAYGTGMDVKNLVNLTRSVFSDGIIATEGTASRVAGALSHVAEGGGLLLGIGNMVLDSIELSKAGTSSQKAIFGTQLAFDSAGTLLSVTGIGAGLLGAATAGAVISGAGVLLGGLAVGFAGLAQAFGKVADDAEEVGLYFDQVFKAYQKGYYLDTSASPAVVRIDLGAVVTKVDLGSRQVAYGSQMLYRTHHGSTGSGKIDYFFWAGDMPEEVRDRSQAINVRAVWNDNKARDIQLPDVGTLPEIAAGTPVLLPGTPPSYIGYDYNLLPGATTKHADGFDLWRIMEQDKKFDFDFYIFPGERIIDTLYQEYDGSSAIEVVLDKADRQLVVPVLPEKMKGNLRYKIHNQGYQCVINLNAGVSLTLTAPDNTTGVKWVLDPGSISADFTFDGTALQLGGDIWITLDGANNQEVLVIQKNKEVCRVDMQKKTFTPIQEDGSKWKVDALHDYLKELAKEHKLDGQYVFIRNFEPSTGKGSVGNAYYDVQNDRFLYTSGLSAEVADSASLAGVLNDQAIFYSKTANSVWATDLKTFTQSKTYSLLSLTAPNRIEKVWISADVVSILQSVDPNGARQAQLIYQINDDRPTLLAIFGADHLIDKLTGKNPFPADLDLLVFLTDTIAHLGHVIHMGTPDTPSGPYSAVAGKIISVATDSPHIDPKLLWIDTEKKTIIIPNLSGISGTDFTLGHFSLIHCVPDKKGRTVHYFLYNLNSDTSAADTSKPLRLFVQIDNQAAVEAKIEGFVYAMAQEDKLFVTTDQGQILYVDSTGNVFLEALTALWLQKNPVWWEALPGLTRQFLVAHTNIPIVGLTVRASGNTLTFPVWYNVVKQSIAITPVSPFKTAKSQNDYPDLAFLGIAEDKQGAYFLDAQNGKVYWQPLPIYRQIEAACANGTDNLDLSAFPDSTPVLPDQKITGAYVDQDHLCVVLEEGLVLKVDLEQNTRIVAVQHNWVGKNRDTLTASLKTACDKYKYDGEAISVFAAKDSNDNSLSWYLPAQEVLLSPPVQPGQVLTYIGYNAAGQTGFFADMNGGAFFSFKDKKLQPLFQFDWVSRFSELFAVIGSEPGTVLSVPLIDHCESVMLATHHGNCQYTIEKDAWDYYSEITVDSRGTNPDKLLLPFTNLSRLSAVKYGDDLLLVESDAEGRYLTIKNAFAPAHPGVIIQTFAPASVNSAKIASIMATYNLASLDLSVQGLALKPVVIKPFTFPNQNLRMDATGVDASNLSGGVVNGKFYEVGPTEQFYLIGQPDGTFVVASVASPGVYLRMDASTVKEFTNSGGGVVNCQYGIGPLTKFYIVPQGGGVSFASQAFPGVFLRFDGTNLVGAPSGKTGSIVNCQFGAKTLETFTINPAG